MLLFIAWLAVLTCWHQRLLDTASLGLASAAVALLLAWLERHHRKAVEQQLVASATERDALMRELANAQQQFATAQRERTQVLAGLGHELREPLQSLRWHVDTMLAQQADSAGADALRQQRRAADEVLGALDQFAEYVDIERGALRPSLRRVNVREVIESVAAAERTAHSGEPISIRTHGRDAWVRSDPAPLRRMVHALMAHAVRQSLRAEQPRHSLVIAAVRPRGDGFCIDIVDNGDGLEREQADRIFQPYALRSPDESTHGARGPGLAIVPGLARQLGMTMAAVQSRRGRGTRFRIVLPAALRWREGKSTPENAPLAGRLLAVLDDDDRARHALVAALQAAGADCVEAPSLTVMRHRLQSQLRFPDALVFEMAPRRPPDGVQAIVRLRDEWQMKVPALLVTAQPNAAPRLPPACVLVEKPVSVHALVQALGQAMAQSA